MTANDQYSVTWIAHVLGAPDGWALRAGSLAYAATAALGVLAGKRLATRFGRPAFVVLVPAAFAVTGGLFIHDLQLPIALPAALLLASVTTGRVRALALAAAIVLAVTWFDDFGAVLALARWACWRGRRRSRSRTRGGERRSRRASAPAMRASSSCSTRSHRTSTPRCRRIPMSAARRTSSRPRRGAASCG